MVEIFKTKNLDNPEFMKDIFQQKNNYYNLRNTELLKLIPTRTTTFGTRSLSFKGSLIWNKLPNNFKKLDQLTYLKN